MFGARKFRDYMERNSTAGGMEEHPDVKVDSISGNYVRGTYKGLDFEVFATPTPQGQGLQDGRVQKFRLSEPAIDHGDPEHISKVIRANYDMEWTQEPTAEDDIEAVKTIVGLFPDKIENPGLSGEVQTPEKEEHPSKEAASGQGFGEQDIEWAKELFGENYSKSLHEAPITIREAAEETFYKPLKDGLALLSKASNSAPNIKMKVEIKKAISQIESEVKKMKKLKFKVAGNVAQEDLEEGLTVPEKHQLKVAKDTLKMSDAGAKIMGGPTKDEAKEIIKRLSKKAGFREEDLEEGFRIHYKNQGKSEKTAVVKDRKDAEERAKFLKSQGATAVRIKEEQTAKNVNEAEKTQMKCMECSKEFKKKIGLKTYEVKCPKCGSTDTEPI